MPIRYFFIDTNVGQLNDSIKPCPRIFKYDDLKFDFPITPNYDSVSLLVRNDPRFKKFKVSRPKLAYTVSLPQNVIHVANYILANSDGDFNNRNWYLLNHTISGNRKRKDFTGIHYLPFPLPNNIVEFEIIDPEDSNGVYVARFSLVNSKGRVLFKQANSSLFPNTWNYQQVYEECDFALDHKTIIPGHRTSFTSYTKSGIPVEIHFGDDWRLRTIYPIRLVE